MPLSPCPKMNMRCPHRQPECYGDEGDACHYVKATTTALNVRLVQLRSAIAAGGKNLHRHTGEIAELEELLAPPRRK